jgi:hypothetical protein
VRKVSLRNPNTGYGIFLSYSTLSVWVEDFASEHLLLVGLTKALKMRKICLTVAEQGSLCPQEGIEADFEDKNKKEKSFAGNFLQSEAFFNY